MLNNLSTGFIKINVTETLKGAIVALAALTSLSTAPVFGATSSFSAGVKFFDNHDYRNAEKQLRIAVAETNSKNPQAHYYLANSLLHLHKTSEAVLEYRTCMALNPDATLKTYCQKGINYCQTKSQSTTVSSKNNNNPKEEGLSAKKSIIIKEIKAQLPSLLHMHRASEPNLREIANRTSGGRINYLGEALERLNEAERLVDRAEQNLKKVNYVISNKIPQQRKYGETETDFRARVATIKDAVQSIKEEYEVQMDKAVQMQTDAQQVVMLCRTSGHTL